MTTPVYGIVLDGAFVPDLPGRHAAALRPLEGQRVELVVRARKSTRSAAQLAWWWGLAIPLMAQELGYDKHEHESLHYALVQTFGGTHQDDRMGVEIPNIVSSRNMSTKVFSEFMEWAVRYASAHLGIVIPLPDEREWERRLAGAA